MYRVTTFQLIYFSATTVLLFCSGLCIFGLIRGLVQFCDSEMMPSSIIASPLVRNSNSASQYLETNCEEIKMHNGTMYHETERIESLKVMHRHLLHLTCSNIGLRDTGSVTMSRGSQLLSSITESCSSCDDCGFLLLNTPT